METIHEDAERTVLWDDSRSEYEVRARGQSRRIGRNQLVSGPQVPDAATIAAIRKHGKYPAEYARLGDVALPRSIAEKICSHAAEQDRKRRQVPDVPGLAELTAAHRAWNDYDEAFRDMMEDGDNDGVNPPARPTVSIEETAKRFPCAAAYLRAEAYSLAANSHKAIAGLKVMELLTGGGEIREAEEILKNWLPEEEMWR